MTIARTSHSHKGFSLIETLVALAMFLVICGAIFKLLNNSQQRFGTESQVLDSFQNARLAMDQIVRDGNDAGYPPLSNFSNAPSTCANVTCKQFVNSPIAWYPGYRALTPCLIGTAGGGTCTTPADFDVIFEEDYDNSGTVSWIRYALIGTTLWRGVIAKSNGNSAWAQLNNGNVMLPYVTDVENNASAADIAKFQANYPSMFPGGTPVPIFQYYCPNPANPPTPPTVLCSTIAAPNNSPMNVTDVEITLIVKTPQRDAQTGAYRLVELNGRAHLINPN